MFSLDVAIPETELRLRITHIGFRPVTKTLPTSDLNSGGALTFLIEPASETLSPVTVLAHRELNSPLQNMDPSNSALLPIDSGAFLRNAGNASGIRKGGFGIDPVLRGLSGSRLNVRLDGLTTTAAACPNRMDPPTSHIRLSDVQSVEIYRGPHALEYGPSFGGTVNFVTHATPDYDSFDVNGDLRTGFESNTGHKKSDMRLQGGSDKWNFLLSGGLSETENYTTGSGSSVPAGFRSYDYGIETGLSVTPNQQLTAGWSQSFIRDADFPALGMDMAIDDTYKFKAGYSWTPRRNENLSSVKVNGYWSLVDHEMNNHNRDAFNMMDAVALAETETYGLHAKMKGLYNSGSYTFAAGLDQQDVTGTRFVDFKMGPRAGNSMEYNLWQDAAITNIGFYGGLDHFIGDYTLSLGTRFDVNSANSNDPAPRFTNTDVDSKHLNFSISAGITRPVSSTTSVGVYLGRGVRSPDITERYINYLTIGRDSYEYAGNPQLDPEANNQLDLVLTSDFGRFGLETTVFGSLMTNYISAVVKPDMQPVGPSAPGVREFQNRGDVVFTGFELSADYSLSTSWFINVSGSYTHAEYTDDNTPVAEIPPLESKVTLGGAILSGKLMPEISVRKVFEQTRIDESFGETQTPGFWLADAHVNARLFDGVRLIGGVRNIFDEAYYEHLNRQFNPAFESTERSLLEPGRRVFLELNVQF
jgi:iron complex outermembrane receptor protein